MNGRPQLIARDGAWSVLVGAGSVSVAAVVALACYVVGPGTAIGVAAAIAFIITAVQRPDLALPAAVALAPFESVQLTVRGIGGLSPTEGAFLALAFGWAVRLAQGRKVALPELSDLPAIALVAAVIPGLAIGAPPPVIAKLVVMWSAFFVVSLVARELSKPQVVRLIVVLGATGAVLAAVAVLSYFSGGGARLTANGTAVTGRASAAIADPNYFGSYLLLTVIPASALVVFGVVRGWRRTALAVAAAVGALGVVLSLSRGALLGLILAVGLVLMSTRHSRAAVVAIAIALTAVTTAGLNPLLQSRAVEVVDTRLSTISSTTTSNNARPRLWSAALQTVEKHPAFGVGALQFREVSQRRGITQRGRPLENVHNAYLNLAAEMGLLGLGAFLAWLLVIGRALRFALRGPVWTRAAAVGVGAALAGYLLQAVTISAYRVEVIQATFFLLAGVALRLRELGFVREASPEPARSEAAALAV